MVQQLQRRLLMGSLVLLVAGVIAPASADAQPPGWEKVKRDVPAARTPEADLVLDLDDDQMPHMVNVQVGYPLVFAPRVFFPFMEKNQIGVGPILLPGLLGLSAEFRHYLVPPRSQKFAWYLDGGLTFYRIRSKDRASSPLGIHVGTGTLFRTTSRFALGGEAGYMGLTGEPGEDPTKSYGLEAGKSTVYVNFQVSYLF